MTSFSIKRPALPSQPVFNASELRSVNITSSEPTDGYVLAYSASQNQLNYVASGGGTSMTRQVLVYRSENFTSSTAYAMLSSETDLPFQLEDDEIIVSGNIFLASDTARGTSTIMLNLYLTELEGVAPGMGTTGFFGYSPPSLSYASPSGDPLAISGTSQQYFLSTTAHTNDMRYLTLDVSSVSGTMNTTIYAFLNILTVGPII